MSASWNHACLITTCSPTKLIVISAREQPLKFPQWQIFSDICIGPWHNALCQLTAGSDGRACIFLNYQNPCASHTHGQTCAFKVRNTFRLLQRPICCGDLFTSSYSRWGCFLRLSRYIWTHMQEFGVRWLTHPILYWFGHRQKHVVFCAESLTTSVSVKLALLRRAINTGCGCHWYGVNGEANKIVATKASIILGFNFLRGSIKLECNVDHLRCASRSGEKGVLFGGGYSTLQACCNSVNWLLGVRH